MSYPPSLCAQLACLLEVSARKPGNVHPGRDFGDLRFVDFLASAVAIGPAFERAAETSVGSTVLQAVRATASVAPSNTNLGMVLLLAPLAAVPADQPLRPGVERVLARLSVDDARQVFEAIRLARPGGMGKVNEEDVSGEPTMPLRDIMRLAADRDLVARQYVNGFADVFDLGMSALGDALRRLKNIEAAVIHTHLVWMAAFPDSLIVRKRGAAEGAEAQRRAGEVLQAGWPETAAGQAAFGQLDAWLCAEGNSRNPGTSADLTTASLFVALREGLLCTS